LRRRIVVTGATTRLLVLLVLSLATPILLVSCTNEQEKPLEQAEEAAGLEEAEQLQPQSENNEQEKTREAAQREYVALVTQVLECQVGEATAGMSEQEADAHLAEVFDEAHTGEEVAAQDILAERGYDCGWKELQASRGEEQDLIRSPRVPFSD
jgi:hypothetical protein